MKTKLMLTASLLVIAVAAPQIVLAAETSSTVVDELVVTAQKREESVQDVPIAVSAFSQEALKQRGIDGATNLIQAIPNLSFARKTLRNNFQIRGVGSALVAISGDDGVGIHHNNAPLTQNRVADADFFDETHLRKTFR